MTIGKGRQWVDGVWMQGKERKAYQYAVQLEQEAIMEQYKDIDDEASAEYAKSRGYKYWQNNDIYLERLQNIDH